MRKIMTGTGKQRARSAFTSRQLLIMPKRRSEMTRVGAKRGRLYNKAFKEMGFLYPSNKAKASAAQKKAYHHVLREFRKSHTKSGNPIKLWYKTSVRLGYLPTPTQRVDIRRRFKELERSSTDKDIKNFKRKYR